MSPTHSPGRATADGAGHQRTLRWWQHIPEIARFELQVQLREPATVLYALIFLLLTFAFISSGTVELVRGQPSLDKLAPLSIALALGGLTAFGQVITTMIAASAMLRDRAWRTDQLLFATPLDMRAYVIGRWAAALAVMVLVYSAMMAGVWLGALAPWVDSEVTIGAVFARTLWSWVTLTVPTTIAIATILVAVAARTQRLLAVLATALALLFLWQGCEAIWRAFAADVVSGGVNSRDLVIRAAALLDPFGTTSVQVVTATWTEQARNEQLVPIAALTGASRLLWLMLAAVVGASTLRSVHASGTRGSYSVRRARDESGERHAPRATHATHSAHSKNANAVPDATRADIEPPDRWVGPWARWFPLAWFTFRWTWMDRGWLVIAALGVLNVLAHVLPASGAAVADVAGLIALVREHARVFFILLATIYAGELLWRDADERIAELVLSTPIATSRLVAARLCGLAIAQASLVFAMLMGAWLCVGVVHDFVALPTLLGAGVVWLLLPFMQWTVLSLSAHVLIRDKIMAHLLLIAGWVCAVVLDANGVSWVWVRFADPPALVPGDALPVQAAVLRAFWWTTVSALLFALTVRRWRSATFRR